MKICGGSESVLPVAAQMHIVFSSLGLSTNAKVFEATANNSEGMPLEMGEDDQDIRLGDGLGNEGLFQNVPFRKIHEHVICSAPPIGNDERTTQSCRREAISLGGHPDIQLGGSTGMR